MFVAAIRIMAILIIDNTAPKIPAMMKGFRFPHLLVLWSLIAPINGCTKVPANGPAIHIRAVVDREKPRDRRYG
jgi:hypothetical protein